MFRAIQSLPFAVRDVFQGDRRTELFRHLRRFVVVGLLSVAADFAGYRLLMQCGLSPHVAKGLSYLAGMVVGYFGNKYWTFESKQHSLSQVATFCGLYATTLGVNVLVNAGVLQLLGRDQVGWAYLTATGVSTVLNFLGLRLLTFRSAINEDVPSTALQEPAAIRKAA